MKTKKQYELSLGIKIFLIGLIIFWIGCYMLCGLYFTMLIGGIFVMFSGTLVRK